LQFFENKHKHNSMGVTVPAGYVPVAGINGPYSFKLGWSEWWVPYNNAQVNK